MDRVIVMVGLYSLRGTVSMSAKAAMMQEGKYQKMLNQNKNICLVSGVMPGQRNMLVCVA